MNDFYLFTETAFHHEGDISYLKSLIESTKNSGANGIKFQVLIEPNNFISKKHTLYEELKSYCLSKNEWCEVFEYAQDLDLDIILMPLDIEALELCYSYKIKYVEIHSVCFNDESLKYKIKDAGVDVILGTGGRTELEIEENIAFFKGKVKLLMVGFQSFPSKIEEIKLSKIRYLKERYPATQIGYADHSSYDDDFKILSNEYAYLLGARVFEKHITITEGTDRVDSASAVTGDSISDVIERLNFLRDYIVVRDEQTFELSKTEIIYRNRQLKVVAAAEIKKGDKVNRSSFNLKMLDVQDAITDVNKVIGKVANIDLESDEAIKISHFK